MVFPSINFPANIDDDIFQRKFVNFWLALEGKDGKRSISLRVLSIVPYNPVIENINILKMIVLSKNIYFY